MLDEAKGLKMINFIQCLKLTDGFFGKPFVVQEWMRKIIMDVYGTVNEEGYRQYNYAYLEIPKKNSKSTTIAGLGVAHLGMDEEEGQIYCCASDREQAGIVYKAAVSMIKQNPTLEKIFKITESKKEIKNKRTGTILKVLSAESYTKHGLGISPTGWETASCKSG